MSAGNGDGRVVLTAEQRERAEALFTTYYADAVRLARGKAHQAFRQDELDDLIQEGLVGLWKAAVKYRPGHRAGAKFWTFAHWYVGGAIEHWLRDHAWVLRTPKWVPASKRWEWIQSILALNARHSESEMGYVNEEHGIGPTEGVPDAAAEAALAEAELLACLPVLDARERLLVAMALGGARRVDLAAADKDALVRLMGKMSDTPSRREATARAAEDMRARTRRLQRRGGRGLRCICCSDPRIDWAIAAGSTYKEAGGKFGISPAAISRHRARHVNRGGRGRGGEMMDMLAERIKDPKTVAV